jgi:hypothetical protein
MKKSFSDHVCAVLFPYFDFNFNLDMRIDILV